MTDDPTRTLRVSYDTYAAERDARGQLDHKANERAPFLARLQAAGARTLLDLGAGPGLDARWFADRGLEVTAVDLSPEMVRLCEQKGIRAQVATFADLPGLGRFDAVWAMTSLLHAPKAQLDGILAHLATCLRDGGLLFVGMYAGDEEGTWEEDRYEPKRFFALWPTVRLRAAIARHFEVLDVHEVEADGSVFQAITARGRSEPPPTGGGQ